MNTRFPVSHIFDWNGMRTHEFSYSLLIDTRPSRDFAAWHIPQALSIPEEKLIDNLPTNHLTPLVIYDTNDPTTQQRAKFIRSLGYKTVYTLAQWWEWYTLSDLPMSRNNLLSPQKITILTCIAIIIVWWVIGSLMDNIARWSIIGWMVISCLLLLFFPAIITTIAKITEKNQEKPEHWSYSLQTMMHKTPVYRFHDDNTPLLTYRRIRDNTLYIIDPLADRSFYQKIIDWREIKLPPIDSIEVFFTSIHGIWLLNHQSHPTIPTRIRWPRIMQTVNHSDIDNPLTNGDYQIIGHHETDNCVRYDIIHRGKSLALYTGLLFANQYRHHQTTPSDLPRIQEIINWILGHKPRKILHHAESIGMSMTNHLDHRYDPHTKRDNLSYPDHPALSARDQRRKEKNTHWTISSPDPIITTNRALTTRCLDTRSPEIMKQYPIQWSRLFPHSLHTQWDTLLPPPQTNRWALFVDTVAQWESYRHHFIIHWYSSLIDTVIIAYQSSKDPNHPIAQNTIIIIDEWSSQNEQENHQSAQYMTQQEFIQFAQNDKSYTLIVRSLEEYAMIIASLRLSKKTSTIAIYYRQ